MIHQVIQTGVVLATLLLIPALMKDRKDPPLWVMLAVMIPGLAGLGMIFVGLLFLIWAS